MFTCILIFENVIFYFFRIGLPFFFQISRFLNWS